MSNKPLHFGCFDTAEYERKRELQERIWWSIGMVAFGVIITLAPIILLS